MIGLSRVLLLVVLAFGVAGVHTVGHGRHAVRGHDTPAADRPHGMLAASGLDSPGGMPVLADGVAPPTGGGITFDLFSVCLAVLGAFGLAIGLVLQRADARRQRPAARTGLAVHRSGCGPPVPLLGLRVAAASVVRI